jgi:two-component system chemotaxis response regulator CheY
MPHPNMKILVVDDCSTMRHILRSILKQLGYCNVEEADNGEHAFALLKKGDFEFVISDWNMPVVDGLQLLTRVRSSPTLKSLPFLMVTSESEKSRVVSAVRAGVNNYLVKPFTIETMKEKLDRIFEKL